MLLPLFGLFLLLQPDLPRRGLPPEQPAFESPMRRRPRQLPSDPVRRQYMMDQRYLSEQIRKFVLSYGEWRTVLLENHDPSTLDSRRLALEREKFDKARKQFEKLIKEPALRRYETRP